MLFLALLTNGTTKEQAVVVVTLVREKKEKKGIDNRVTNFPKEGLGGRLLAISLAAASLLSCLQ